MRLEIASVQLILNTQPKRLGLPRIRAVRNELIENHQLYEEVDYNVR